MPPKKRSALKLTIIGVVVVERQCGKIQALRKLEYRAAWKSGFGSTRRPDYFRVKQVQCIGLDVSKLQYTYSKIRYKVII